MDDALRLRALETIGIHVAHDIVPHDALPRLGILVIDLILMRLELRDLLVGNIQPELLLCLRKRNPQPSPGAELLLL